MRHTTESASRDADRRRAIEALVLLVTDKSDAMQLARGKVLARDLRAGMNLLASFAVLQSARRSADGRQARVKNFRRALRRSALRLVKKRAAADRVSLLFLRAQNLLASIPASFSVFRTHT